MLFSVVNLGCKVNRVESDACAVLLESLGWEMAATEAADLVVVNTCTVTAEADKKTRKAVRHALSINPVARVIVTGCAAAMTPEVFTGMSARVQVVSKAGLHDAVALIAAAEGCGRAAALQGGQGVSRLQDEQGDPRGCSEALPAAVLLPVGDSFRTRVGVKIQDGCNNACTYCIVHVARGRSTSMPSSQVIAQCRALHEAGVREIVLTGINLGCYRDPEGNYPTLAALLGALLDATSERPPLREGGVMGDSARRPACEEGVAGDSEMRLPREGGVAGDGARRLPREGGVAGDGARRLPCEGGVAGDGGGGASRPDRKGVVRGGSARQLLVSDASGYDTEGARCPLGGEDDAGVQTRFRIGSIEPRDVTPELIELMAASGGRIARHLHLPLQSGSTKVLREMARPYTARAFEELVARMRTAMPGLALSTDVIVGFPGETEEDFADTVAVCERSRFMKLHVFPYSIRQGTPAAERADQVPPEVKQARAAILRDLSNRLAAADFAARTGQIELVLVEQEGRGTTESYHEIPVSPDLPVGSLVPVAISAVSSDEKVDICL